MSSDGLKKKVKAEKWRLGHIVEHIDLATRIIGERAEDAFMEDSQAILAVERCMQIVTEAVIQIGEERMGEIAPDQPWHAIRAMGNILRHEYWGIDRTVIYNTVRDDFPLLRNHCLIALEKYHSQD